MPFDFYEGVLANLFHPVLLRVRWAGLEAGIYELRGCATSSFNPMLQQSPAYGGGGPTRPTKD